MIKVLLFLILLSLVSGGVIKKQGNSQDFVLPSGENEKPSMTFTEEPKPYTITTLGSSVTLSCSGTSSVPNGEPSVTWLFSEKITPGMFSTMEELVGGKSGVLILGNLQKEEGGYYFCNLTDGYGYSLVSRGAQVVVTYLDPDFVEYPTAMTITESTSYIRIPCQPPPSNPPAVINWYKDGDIIEEVPNMIQELKSTSSYGSLIIFNPRTTDSGLYACEAVNVNANPEKRKTSDVEIDIQVDGQGTFPQKFVQDHSVLVKKGGDAVLKAGAIGFPVPTYKWTLGVSVEIDVNNVNVSLRDGGRELHITNVQVTDRGTYWCQYNNVYTDSVAVVRLYVIVDISFNTVLTPQTVEHLTPMTFDCQCSGTPYTSGDPTAPPSITWLRDGKPIIDGDRFKEEDGNLIVEGLEMKETGMYQCFCYNAQQITQSYMPVHVKNMTVPVSIDGNDRAEGVYNENIQILCRANGYPLPVVTWYKDNQEVKPTFNDRWTITQQNFHDYVISQLTVLSVKEQDAGQLLCRAVNSKVITFTAELGITFVVGHEIAPSISLSDISIQVDSSITFSAVSYGYPTPAVTWYKGVDKVPILSDGRFSISGSSLYISSAQSSDTGLYIVMAHNGVGEAASANATITLSSNSSVKIIGSLGGLFGFLIIICVLLLLYVLFQQKQRKNAVPPHSAKTPTEKEIEKRKSAKSDKAGASDDKNHSNITNITNMEEDIEDAADKVELEMTMCQAPGQVEELPVPATLYPDLPSPPSTSSSSSGSDTDSSTDGSNTKIVKKVRKSKVSPS